MLNWAFLLPHFKGGKTSVLDRFREKMHANSLDAFLVTQPENRRYLSGFTGSAGVLLVTSEKQFLATDSRYYERAKKETPDWALVEAGHKTMDEINYLLPDHRLSGKKIGI